MKTNNKSKMNKVRIDGEELGHYDPDRVKLDNILKLTENKTPTWGISIEEQEGGSGNITSFYAREYNPWKRFEISKYQDLLPLKKSNHYQIKLNKHEGLVVSLVNINDIAKIIKENTFDDQISTWSEERKFKVKNLKQFQNFFITEYGLSLAENATAYCPEIIKQPPTKEELERIKEDLKNFYDFITNDLEKAILINEYADEIKFTSIYNHNLVLPITNYNFVPSNRDFIDWNGMKGLHLIIQHDTLVFNTKDSKNTYVEKEDYFGITPETEIVYEGNHEGQNALIKRNLFNKSFVHIIPDKNIEEYVDDKVKSIKGTKVFERKKIKDDNLIKIVDQTLEAYKTF